MPAAPPHTGHQQALCALQNRDACNVIALQRVCRSLGAGGAGTRHCKALCVVHVLSVDVLEGVSRNVYKTVRGCL
jgi:hypothetical protein